MRFDNTAKFQWKIDVDSERVLFHLGGHLFKLHFEAAAKLALHIKREVKTAKAWAGDTGRRFICVGNLTNAEDNYRRGI